MTTAKQRTANRHNAQKSTGPTTAAGKAVVACNALKHGLLSGQVLLPEEDEAALVALGERLRAHLQPLGELEVLLVEHMITAAWRLRRLLRVEHYLFGDRFSDTRARCRLPVGEAFVSDYSDKFSKLSRYETTIERSFYKALHELQRLQAARSGVLVPPPAAVDVEVHVMGQGSGDDPS